MKADLAKLRALHEAATPGPWEVKTQDEWDQGYDFFGGIAKSFVFPVDLEPEDVALIQAAVNALPDLIAEIERLRAIAEAVERAPVVTISRADVGAWNLPDSWSGQRARLLAIGEDG